MEKLEFKSDKEFALAFNDYLEQIWEDPLGFFIESNIFMDFEPTPAQVVALKCVFGQELDPISPHYVWMEFKDPEGLFALEKIQMTEVDLFKFMTDKDYQPEYQSERNRINLIVGRRGGKTTISAMLAIYCAIKMNWKPYLKKNKKAAVVILSHSREFSDEVLELIKHFMESSPVLCRLVDKKEKQTQSIFNLKIPFIEKGKVVNSLVRIKVGTANKKNVRGQAICALLCDEIAYWNLDENAAERDVDILRAARPALLQFREHGLLIKLSSPGIKQGILYDEFMRKDELPKSYLTLKAPSWVWNTILMENEFKEEYILDPVGFDAEYRANFVDSISNFIMPEFVDLCVLKGKTFEVPEPRNSDVVYCASIDAAFKGDRFAFTLVGYDGHKMRQYVVKTWQGSRLKPVKSKIVAEYIRNICKEYGITRVYADQFSFQPLREIFEQYGVTLIEKPFTNTFKKQIYFNLKNAIHNQKIDLLDYQYQSDEIKQLQVEQTATGTVRIGHAPGGHDDCSDCLAVSVYILTYELNALGIAEGDVAGSEGPEIRTDATGRAFDAPTPEMLAPFYGTAFVDNSKEWIKNKETGKWQHISELEDEDPEGGNEGGADFSF